MIKNQDSLGEQIARQLAISAHRTGWRWNLLSLAWSAGPVTFVALVAGSYMGFGKAPTFDTFVYFAGYTLVAGVIATIIGFIRHRIILPRVESADDALKQFVNSLFNLHFLARDFYIQTYDIDEQRKIATRWILSTASASAEAIEEAVYDLTGDSDLAHSLKRIEIYRRSGLKSLMQAESALCENKLNEQLVTLTTNHPVTAAYLEERFRGEEPTLRRGQLRNKGFLARFLEVANNEDLEWLSLEDMLSAYILTLEVLLGRSILTIHPVFSNAPKLEAAKKKLDTTLSDFRLQRRKRNSYLRLLLRHLQILAQEPVLPLMGVSGKDLFERAQLIMKSAKFTDEQAAPLRKFYILALRANTKMKQSYSTLKSAEKAYNKQWAKTKFTDATIIRDISDTRKTKGVSLYLKEKVIHLTDEQKFEVVEQLSNLYSKQFSDEHSITLEDCKQFAVTCINTLDDFLNISEPEEQMAIEESRQTDFGCIEPGLTAPTKLAWGTLVVKEIQETRTATIHRLARELVRFLNVPLHETSIIYLVENYGASEEYLRNLIGQEKNETRLASAQLKQTIYDLPSWKEFSR